jgi:hypothetical protein
MTHECAPSAHLHVWAIITSVTGPVKHFAGFLHKIPDNGLLYRAWQRRLIESRSWLPLCLSKGNVALLQLSIAEPKYHSTAHTPPHQLDSSLLWEKGINYIRPSVTPIHRVAYLVHVFRVMCRQTGCFISTNIYIRRMEQSCLLT